MSLVEKQSPLYLSVDSRRDDHFMTTPICSVASPPSTYYYDYPVNSNLFTLVPRDQTGISTCLAVTDLLEQACASSEITKPNHLGLLKSTNGVVKTAGFDIKPSDGSSVTHVSYCYVLQFK